jgi:hypothetical protein
MCLPSGAQVKFDTAVSDFVSCTASPPSALMAKTWLRSPTRGLVNAIQRPSGDQRGLVEDLSPRVNCIVRFVAASASQSCVTNASCSKSVSVVV